MPCTSMPTRSIPPAALAPLPPNRPAIETGWLDAVRDGIAEEMRRNPNMIYFGEGTGERGGTFAHTKNLYQEFGPERMVDTPISELGFTGAALGASATGVRCIADLMFADFLFEAAGQIVLQAAKLRYMSNGQMQAPMVVRVGAGAVRSAGPHHSGTYHPVWAHIPGLIVCLPVDAGGCQGADEDGPSGPRPRDHARDQGPVRVEGAGAGRRAPRAVRRRADRAGGRDLTIASAGQLVFKALEAAEILAEEGIQVEVIDLRTIQPLDVETVADSVRRTHRLLVVDEAYAMFGVGAELAQAMNELCFDELDGPVARLHTAPVTHPFAPSLERAMLVSTEMIVERARRVVAGHADPIERIGRQRTYGVVDLPAAAPIALRAASGAPPAAPASFPIEPAVDGEPITMPFGDLTVSEGGLVKWYRKLGDRVSPASMLRISRPRRRSSRSSRPKRRPGAGLADEGAIVPMGASIGIVREDA